MTERENKENQPPRRIEARNQQKQLQRVDCSRLINALQSVEAYFSYSAYRFSYHRSEGSHQQLRKHEPSSGKTQAGKLFEQSSPVPVAQPRRIAGE